MSGPLVGRPSILACPPVALATIRPVVIRIVARTTIARPPLRTRPFFFIARHMLPPHHQGKTEKRPGRSEEHTSELQSLMRTSYAVFCLKKKNQHHEHNQ